MWPLLYACAASPDHPAASDPCDRDGDGYQIRGEACADVGATADCDDLDATVHPDALEYCDGIDNNCTGAADDAGDADRDGWSVCFDCDDAEATAFPGGTEVCDAIDNDCSGFADEPFDADGDGFSACMGDCDDNDARRSAGLTEQCDGYDNDCDGVVDEGFDEDADGYLTCRGDCNDQDPTVHTGAVESCDGVDQDCNGALDDVVACTTCVAVGGYVVCDTPQAWSIALRLCQDMGLTLACATDEGNNAGTAAAAGVDGAWLGGTDDDDEGTWIWANGQPWSYTAWSAGQPDNDGGEDCLTTGVETIGAWDDRDCDELHPFVCQPG